MFHILLQTEYNYYRYIAQYKYHQHIRPIPFTPRDRTGWDGMGNAFFQNAKMKVFLHVCHQEGPGTSQKCRIASLQEGRTVGPSVYPWIKLKKQVERTHLLVDQTCLPYTSILFLSSVQQWYTCDDIQRYNASGRKSDECHLRTDFYCRSKRTDVTRLTA